VQKTQWGTLPLFEGNFHPMSMASSSASECGFVHHLSPNLVYQRRSASTNSRTAAVGNTRPWTRVVGDAGSGTSGKKLGGITLYVLREWSGSATSGEYGPRPTWRRLAGAEAEAEARGPAVTCRPPASSSSVSSSPSPPSSVPEDHVSLPRVAAAEAAAVGGEGVAVSLSVAAGSAAAAAEADAPLLPPEDDTAGLSRNAASMETRSAAGTSHSASTRAMAATTVASFALSATRFTFSSARYRAFAARVARSLATAAAANSASFSTWLLGAAGAAGAAGALIAARGCDAATSRRRVPRRGNASQLDGAAARRRCVTKHKTHASRWRHNRDMQKPEDGARAEKAPAPTTAADVDAEKASALAKAKAEAKSTIVFALLMVLPIVYALTLLAVGYMGYGVHVLAWAVPALVLLWALRVTVGRGREDTFIALLVAINVIVSVFATSMLSALAYGHVVELRDSMDVFFATYLHTATFPLAHVPAAVPAAVTNATGLVALPVIYVLLMVIMVAGLLAIAADALLVVSPVAVLALAAGKGLQMLMAQAR